MDCHPSPLHFLQNYFDRIEDLKTVCQNFLVIRQKQDSVSYQTLSEEWEKDIIEYIEEIEGRLTIMKMMLSNYVDDYNTLANFRSGSVSSAFCIFRKELEEIQRTYKESIVPFENTDDDYATYALFYYDI